MSVTEMGFGSHWSWNSSTGVEISSSQHLPQDQHWTYFAFPTICSPFPVHITHPTIYTKWLALAKCIESALHQYWSLFTKVATGHLSLALSPVLDFLHISCPLALDPEHCPVSPWYSCLGSALRFQRRPLPNILTRRKSPVRHCCLVCCACQSV